MPVPCLKSSDVKKAGKARFTRFKMAAADMTHRFSLLRPGSTGGQTAYEAIFAPNRGSVY